MFECTIDCYIYKMFYIILMVTVKQTPTIGLQKMKRITEYHCGKITNSQRRSSGEEERNKGLQNYQKTMNEMA